MYMVLGSTLISFFYTELPSFPSTSCQINCLFSIVYFCLLYHRLDDHKCWGLFLYYLSCSIDLYFCTYLNTLDFDYCGFVVQSEVRDPDSSSYFFLLQDCFDSLQFFFLCFNINYKLFFSNSVKNAIGTLIRILPNLQIAFGGIVILIILILPI